MSDDTLLKISNYVASEIIRQPNKIINPDDALLSSGIIDSFHLVDLALFVEDNFGVHIDDAELNASTFDSLNQLVAFIQARK